MFPLLLESTVSNAATKIEILAEQRKIKADQLRISGSGEQGLSVNAVFQPVDGGTVCGDIQREKVQC